MSNTMPKLSDEKLSFRETSISRVSGRCVNKPVMIPKPLFFSLTDKNAVVSPPCLLLTAKDTLTQCSLFLARRRQSLCSHERPERWYGFLRTHSCLPIKSKPSLRILYNIINMKKKKLNNNLQPYPFSAINQMF